MSKPTNLEIEDEMGWDEGTIASHPSTKDCPEPECFVCAVRDCPYGEPLHYDKDGCPACYRDELKRRKQKTMDDTCKLSLEERQQNFRVGFVDGASFSGKARHLYANPDYQRGYEHGYETRRAALEAFAKEIGLICQPVSG